VSEVHDAVGSYVVDALESDERERFEAHLAVCPACRREVMELSETAAELGRVAAAAPPPALRAAVLDGIREVSPLPPHVEPAEVAAVDELAVRRARRARAWLTAAVAAALVVALALGGWVYALTAQRQAQIASSQVVAAQNRAETELLSAPDVRVVPIRVNGAPASFAVSESLNRAMFYGADLPSPGPGRTYQLWTIHSPEDIRPDKLVEAGGTTRVFLDGDVRQAAALALSIEPAGGSAQPTPDQILARQQI